MIARGKAENWRWVSLTIGAGALSLLLACGLCAGALAARRLTRVAAAPRTLSPVFSAQLTRRGAADPVANREPSAATQRACGAAPFSTGCEVAVLTDIHAARVAEGVGPMILPSIFNSLSVPQQLLVLANLERVGRGLVPVSGLSGSLNTIAAVAAAANLDPNPSSFHGNVMAANWAGGYGSPLLVDFMWMYDDGPGSSNIDCKTPTDPGCWGHRQNILYPFNPPVAMGAAELDTATFASSMTELFVGGDWATAAGGADALLSPSWAAISQPVSLLPSAARVGLTGGAGSAQIEVRSGGDPVQFAASITRGVGNWQVSRSTCVATSSSACALTVTANGVGTGTLTLFGPAGQYSIDLTSQAPSQLSIRTPPGGLGRVRWAMVTARLSAGGAGVPGQLVTLWARSGGSATATVRARARTSSTGMVSFRVSPRVTTQYSIAFPGSTTLGASAAGPAVIRVRRR